MHNFITCSFLGRVPALGSNIYPGGIEHMYDIFKDLLIYIPGVPQLNVPRI